MGRLADMIASYVDRAIKSLPVITAVGTVVTSPGQVSTDPMTVVIDGSATSVPVKLVRGLPMSQGARVVLVKFGSDWTIVGSLTNPSVGTNTSRMVIGADTPAELKAYGIDTAILSYLNDVATGIEVGYFFIGTSNRFDGSGTNRVQAFGNVVYPTPGVPSSATMSNVKTNFQQNMNSPFPQTIFKDQAVQFWTNLQLETTNGFTKLTVGDASGNLAVQMDGNDVRAGAPGTSTVETWHALALLNLWVNNGGGFVTPQYRRVASPAKTVQLLGAIANGTNAAGTIIGNVGVGYRPVSIQPVPLMTFGAGHSITTEAPRLDVQVNGDLVLRGTAGATFIGFNGSYSLDAA